MKNIQYMLGFLLLSVIAIGANDDILSDWVILPSGDLVLKNSTANPIDLVYQLPSTKGIKKGTITIEPKASPMVAISAFQVFRSDLVLLWNGHNVLADARNYLGDTFTKKYGTTFNCTPACCSVTCQSENLIRAFLAKGKRFTSELELYKKKLTGTKVQLEFSRDAKGAFVTTRIDNFSHTRRL